MVENEEDGKEFREIPINNPFIRSDDHWDRDNQLYDKVKVNSCVIIDLTESSRGRYFCDRGFSLCVLFSQAVSKPAHKHYHRMIMDSTELMRQFMYIIVMN